MICVKWLEIIRTFWPIVATLTPFIFIGFILWLRSQFALKAELETEKQRINTKVSISDLEVERSRITLLERSLFDQDKRVALVEDDCDSSPSRQDLNQGVAVLAGRLSGVERGLMGVEKQLSTQHDYLRTLLEQGLRSK